MASQNSDNYNEQPLNQKVDYSEQHDITHLHAAVVREEEEPTDGNEPISLWLVAFFGLTLVVGGLYLGMYSGGFRWDVYSHYEGGKTGAGDGEAEVVQLSLAEEGEKVYKQNCVACHGANGQGQAGLYPPLVNGHWVVGNERSVTGVVLNGLQGPLEVDGVMYNGAMPPWGSALNDRRLAGVLTYIRQTWGNQAGEITEAQVAEARKIFAERKTPWTVEELEQLPDDPIPGGGGEAAPAEGEAAPAEGAPAEGAEAAL